MGEERKYFCSDSRNRRKHHQPKDSSCSPPSNLLTGSRKGNCTVSHSSRLAVIPATVSRRGSTQASPAQVFI